MLSNNWKALAIALACCLSTSCGVGKDKYADLSCDKLRIVQDQEQSRANNAAQAFQRNPTTANKAAMKDAQANAMYAADARRDKKCSE